MKDGQHQERLKKGGQSSQSSPSPVCTVCAAAETACRQGPMERWHHCGTAFKRIFYNIYVEKEDVSLQYNRLRCFKCLWPGGHFQGKMHRKWCIQQYWQQRQWFVWTKQWKISAVLTPHEWMGLDLTITFTFSNLLIIFFWRRLENKSNKITGLQDLM